MRSKSHKGLESEKTGKTTTIEVSIETANKLHSTATQIEIIMHKRHVSLDQVIKLFYVLNPLDELIKENW